MALLIRRRGWGWVLRGQGQQEETGQGPGTRLAASEPGEHVHKASVGAERGCAMLEEHRGGRLQYPPAFLVVKYIIRFFFFPERLPQRVPGRRERGG